jgi:hypothetical protein
MDPGIDRQEMFEQTGGDPVGHERRQMSPQLVELGRRAAMCRPVGTSLHPTALGTAETGQPERDLAEHGGDPVGPIVLDLTRCRARSAGRPLSGMVAALRRDQRLLDLGHKLLAIHQAQS